MNFGALRLFALRWHFGQKLIMPTLCNRVQRLTLTLLTELTLL